MRTLEEEIWERMLGRKHEKEKRCGAAAGKADGDGSRQWKNNCVFLKIGIDKYY